MSEQELHDSNTDKGNEETAGEKLRRLLSSRGKEKQPIKSVSSSGLGRDNGKNELQKGTEEDSSELINNEENRFPEALGEDSHPMQESVSTQEENKGSFWEKTQARIQETFSNWKGIRLPNWSLKGRLFRNFTKNPKGCIVYGLLGLIFFVIIVGIIVLSLFIIQYFRIASDLPSVDDLRAYASQFETTRIYDRNGNLIYEIIDPNAGRRTHVTLDEISPYLIAATIATEDKDFYTNPGFDPWGIIRALWQNYTSGRVVSGASTITQQLARTLLLSPQERTQITTRRKAREIVLAAEITRKYNKNEILELYLNENNYGNLAYGIEAAAETYFNTTADQLTLAQASFIAGIPQAPSVYDIHTNPEASLFRHLDVLNLMYQLSTERGCISVSGAEIPVCVTMDDAVMAAQEIESYPFEPREFSMPYPHWVNFIRIQLEEQFDPQTIYRSGFRVYTTLDPELQRFTQESLKGQVAGLKANDATSGAVVAMQPSSGEILAMVGSADFFDDSIDGQVNMAISPRQPGSSIKPFTYLAAFEKGWTPATLIWDVPSEFPPSGNPDDTREPYKPVNYDEKFHGPVLLRTALGSSYNIPAVKALDFVGIYDNPDTVEKDGLIAFLERMGITTLDRSDYGLSLTLGGGDVSLLELTNAYAILANEGKDVQPFAILKIEDHSGNVVYEHEEENRAQTVRRDHAYLISDILSDNSARTPAFGSNSILRLPFDAAVKTGTTNDFRDNWTLGYTPDVAVGVWIGNADYTPMKNISGVSGAGPLWNAMMLWIAEHYSNSTPMNFSRPDDIEEHVICRVSGTRPSDKCSLHRNEVFAKGQPPKDADQDLWQEIALDTWTNLKSGSACTEFTEEKLTINVSEKWAMKWLNETEAGETWLTENGFNIPVIFTPDRECTADDSRPTIVFVGLTDGMDIPSSPLDIYAVINATENFKNYTLQYGIGNNPSKWKTIAKGSDQFKEPAKLVTWDVYEADATRITLRIVLESTINTQAEKRIKLNLTVPTQTPMITATPTATDIPTITPSPTETPLPTDTGTPIPTFTNTPEPSPSP